MTLTLSKHAIFPAAPGPVVLVILDGVGLGPQDEGNAWHLARTPVLDRLMHEPVRGSLRAHGPAVGLPSEDDLGNSEVGHNALGAGGIFDQGSKLVTQAIASRRILRSLPSPLLRGLNETAGRCRVVLAPRLGGSTWHFRVGQFRQSLVESANGQVPLRSGRRQNQAIREADVLRAPELG